MLNPTAGSGSTGCRAGLDDTGCRVTPADGERIVRLVAHHVGVEVHAGSPRVSAELPETRGAVRGPAAAGGGGAGLRHPQARPSRSSRSTTTSRPGSCPPARPSCCARRSRERKNILVAGGTSTGKTTLVNALLAEVAKTGDRVVLIEDTRELQCAAPNLVALRTKDGVASLSDLVRSSPAAAARPHSDRRGARRRGARSAEGLGHRPSRRDRHHPRRLRHRRAAPPRAAHPGSRRHRPARADRRDHRPHRGARRPRLPRAGSPSSPRVEGLGPPATTSSPPARRHRDAR